jgi:hypothetical protein
MPIAEPPAIAFATVRDQPVYDPEGDIDTTGRAMKEAPHSHAANPEH